MTAILRIYLYKGILFGSSHSLSPKKCPVNMGQIYRRRPIRRGYFKKCCIALLHGCSTVNLLDKFAEYVFQNTISGGLALCFISCVLVQVKNSTFYWLAFTIYRPEYADWTEIFLKVFLILWYIFKNNFPNACRISTTYIFLVFFCQTNVRCNCRSSPPQVFMHLIYTSYKCEMNNFINNVMKIFLLYTF